jgi:thermostable 8-oxoguanine DNA glycosylase
MTRPELQYWILFSMAVAGKGAKVTEQKMLSFLREESRPLLPPFGVVKLYILRGELLRKMRKHKLGKYTLLNKGFRAALDLDLDDLTVAKLDAIPGIGPKSARMIMMYGFPDQKEYAVLDTHVLKWLKAHGHEVPRATPDGKTYDRLEKIVLTEAQARGMTARQFDTFVWQMYAKI